MSNPFCFPAHEVQRPTHDRIHIRSAEDAHILFEAVRVGVLRPVIRRLNDTERSAFIRSGSVFVWEESEEAIGLRRWTDGLMWSASRMREPFLFYESKLRGRSSIGSNVSAPNERRSTETLYSTSSADTSSPRSSFEQTIPGLVKQTYSAFVMGDGSKRKWHMTAYFTNADYPTLPTVQDDPRLKSMAVPRGMYRSGKSRQSAKSLQSEWAGTGNASTPDLSSLLTGRPQGECKSITACSTGYETPSPSGSPTMEYRLRRASPSSPYSRPASSGSLTYPASGLPSPSYSQPSRPPSDYGAPSSQPLRGAPGALPPSPQAAYPLPPPFQGSLLPPLRSTYSDQRYVIPSQRSMNRTAEDERVLRMFRPIP